MDIIKSLINAGASSDTRNPRSGNNILQTAIESSECSNDLVKYLIETDKDLVTEKNGSGFDAIDIAIAKKYPDQIINIMKNSVDPTFFMEKLAIKEETSDFYDDDQENTESSQHSIEIVTNSSSSSGIHKNENFVKFFDEECLNQMRLILDKNDKWQQIAELLGFGELESVWATQDSPTTSMLKHIEVILWLIEVIRNNN